MLFKVEADKSVFETNPGLKADPVFSKSPERTLRYIFLMYDYKSPYRQLPIPKRRDLCLELSGFKREKRKDLKPGRQQSWDKSAYDVSRLAVPTAKGAYNRFKEIQHDEDMETLIAYDQQIEQFRDIMKKKTKDDHELKFALAVMKEMPKLLAARKEIIENLDLVEEQYLPEIEVEEPQEDKEELSTLDKLNMGNLNAE